MIDLHAHVLPGIDDGPATEAESLELLRAMEAAGIHLVTATPHLNAEHPAVVAGELRERAAKLDAAAASAGIGVRVLPGGEVDLLWAHDASDAQLRLATVAQRGTDLLLETPYGALPSAFGQEIFRLQTLGIRVLIAHPERNPTVQRNPQLVVDLVGHGALVQVTAMSVSNPDPESKSGRIARWLVEHDAAHVLATDAHAAGDWRGPDLRPAVDALRAIAPGRADWMLHEVPQAIVAGHPLPPRPAPASDRRPRTRLPRLRRRSLKSKP